MPINRAPADRFAQDEEDVLTVGPWPLGLDTRRHDDGLVPEALRNAVNVDLDRDGHLSRRDGNTERLPGSTHSLFSNDSILLAVIDNNLVGVTVNEDTGALTTQTFHTGLAPNRPVVYADTTERICYTNGIITGTIRNGVRIPWGVQRPASVPALMAVGFGGLDAGIYQVTVTFISDIGEESGAGPAAAVFVVEGQALLVSSIPQPVEPNITRVRVYRTEAGGEVFYIAAELPVGVTMISLSRVINLGDILRTQFLSPPPIGQALTAYNGSVFIAQGSTLWFTEPLRYGAVHFEGFKIFPTDIDILVNATTGIYVVADQHYWLTGGNPATFELIAKLPFGAVRGSAAVLDFSQSHVGASRVSKVAATREAGHVWMSDRGLVIANQTGDLRVVSEDAIAVAPAREGATLVRDSNGIRLVVSSVRGIEHSPSHSQDFLRAETMRLSAC